MAHTQNSDRSWATDYQGDFLLVLALGFAAFSYTALLSYSPLDSAWNAANYPEQVPANLGGKLGAILSSAVLYWFGLAAYLLPVPSLVMTIQRLALREGRGWMFGLKRNMVRSSGWVLAILAGAGAAAMKLPPLIYDEYPLASGGTVGGALSASLLKWFGDGGAIVVLVTAAVAGFLLLARLPLISTAIEGTSRGGRSLARYASNKWPRLGGRLSGLGTGLGTGLGIGSLFAIFKRTRGGGSDSKEATPDFVELPLDSEPFPLVEDSVDREPSPDLNPFRDLDISRPRPNTSKYSPPPVSIFERAPTKGVGRLDRKETDATARLLVKTLEDFNVKGEIVGYQPGPVVTVYEFGLEAGVKQAKVLALLDDLALALRVDSVLVGPVKGKRALGIQVPNKRRETVFFGDVLSSERFGNSSAPLTFAMGKSLSGDVVCCDLAKTPHLLVAGATGSGKSVGINSLLCSVIMKSSPDSVRMILVDPKMLELSIYNGIPHLLMPVITEAPKAALALRWAVTEMERRYSLMQKFRVRNIDAFNAYWSTLDEAKKAEAQQECEEEIPGTIPYILIVIDELADLMLSAPKEIETIIQKLAQKARASGIHMVLATQRPSVDIITGVIKANLPSRLAFQVVAKHDSRTILDQMGAERLLGRGDMLFQRPGINYLERIQGAFVSDREVVALVENLRARENADYDDNLINWIEEEANREAKDSPDLVASDVDEDPKWDEAISIGQKNGVISASYLQRQLKIGYNRAARMVEVMEAQGLVSGPDGSKPRKWIGPSGLGAPEGAPAAE